jgi:hypothetical protein
MFFFNLQGTDALSDIGNNTLNLSNGISDHNSDHRKL